MASCRGRAIARCSYRRAANKIASQHSLKDLNSSRRRFVSGKSSLIELADHGQLRLRRGADVKFSICPFARIIFPIRLWMESGEADRADDKFNKTCLRNFIIEI